MTLYEALLIVHILAAAVIIGAAAALSILGARATSSGDEREIVGFTEISDFLGGRLFGPTAIVLLIAGIWAVFEGNWEFSDAWISIGFGVWIVLSLVGAIYFPRNGRAVRAAVTDHGARAPQTLSHLRAGATVAAFQLILLVVAVWAMVAKPGL